MGRILVVDDEQASCELLEEFLRAEMPQLARSASLAGGSARLKHALGSRPTVSRA